MTLTHLPGFRDPVHDAQQTFRALLAAIARPGLPQTTVSLQPPEGLVPSCAAAALTLLDLETTVWLQPGFPQGVQSWLLFHTGCRFTDHMPQADFALLWNVAAAPSLQAFNWGTAEYPEASTSLLVQCTALAGGTPVTLSGPGILDSVTVALPLPPQFWQQWQTMTASYPRGLDGWCFSGQQVIGLPRTARPALPTT